MLDKQLYEYAILRLMPRVEREEFINIGVVLFCKKTKYLDCKILLNPEKINAFCKELDLEELKSHVASFKTICLGKNGGVIGQLDEASRFRWLTATRSTILQTSKVHPGLCSNLNEKLEQLFLAFVQ